MSNERRYILVVIPALAILSSQTVADFVTFTNFEAWSNAAGEFHAIQFDEFPAGTPLNDQYTDLGLEISGIPPAFIATSNDADGFQMMSFGEVFLDFAFPQFEFGVDYPGVIRIEALSDGVQVFIDDFFITGFGGIVSDTPFDSIRLSAFDGPPIFADNIYFTVPAPGALTVFAVACLAPRGRRRTRSR